MTKWIVPLVAMGCLLGVALWFHADITAVLLFGWVLFLWDVLPRVSVDLPTVELAGVAFALFVVGIHWFGVSWARRHVGPASQGKWRARWSLASALAVAVLFAAGICLIGIVHQTAWLLNDEKPLYGEMLQSHDNPSRASSINQAKMIGLGMGNYKSCYREFPAGGTFTADGEMLHSWETLLLPYMFYMTPDVDLSLPWRDERNAPTFRGIVPTFINPGFRVAELRDGEGFGLSHYAANGRVLGANKPLKQSEITKGGANTILVGEVNANFRPWGHPVNWRDPTKGINRSPDGFGGPLRSGGVNFVMADGSSRFISDRVEPKVLRALAAAGDEAVEP